MLDHDKSSIAQRYYDALLCSAMLNSVLLDCVLCVCAMLCDELFAKCLLYESTQKNQLMLKVLRIFFLHIFVVFLNLLCHPCEHVYRIATSLYMLHVCLYIYFIAMCVCFFSSISSRFFLSLNSWRYCALCKTLRM